MTGSKKNDKDPKPARKDVVTDEKDVLKTLTSGNSKMSPTKAKNMAKDAVSVVRDLGTEDFIKQHWDKISEKLIQCEKFANEVSYGADMMFVSMAIPLVNGIIHVASSRDKLLKTTKRFADDWKRAGIDEPERVPIVSALTLIYLVTRGLEYSEGEADALNHPLWERMKLRVQHLSSDKGGGGASQPSGGKAG
ncbi:MAG TPA: hypothetical protein VF659_12490 [Pyrinomonadaceae bacterium]|jgi:hypothetical protein